MNNMIYWFMVFGLMFAAYETAMIIATLKYAPYKIRGAEVRIIEEITMADNETQKSIYYIEAQHPLFKLVWIPCSAASIVLSDKKYYDSIEEAQRVVDSWKSAREALNNIKTVKKVVKSEP
jgi:hypothetical protein